jgi:GNAT superfamily N-acetyltransferase
MQSSRTVLDAVELRDFRPDDQDTVRALIIGGLEEHWGRIDERLNADVGDLLASYGHGRIVVAQLGDVIVGTGTAIPRADSVVEILRMSILRGRRRSGIGRLVVDELLATARRWGAVRVVLETTADWHEVVRFYLSCGFTVTHEQEGPLGRDKWFEKRL